jgi:hypothetical protein
MTSPNERVYVDGVFDSLIVNSTDGNSSSQGVLVKKTYKLPPLGPVGDYPFVKNNSGKSLNVLIFQLHQNTFGATQGEITIRQNPTIIVDPIWFSDNTTVGYNTSVPRNQSDYVFQKGGGLFGTGPLIWKPNEVLNIFIQSGDATGVTGEIDLYYFV